MQFLHNSNDNNIMKKYFLLIGLLFSIAAFSQIQTFQLAGRTYATLTDGATITWDLQTGFDRYVTLGGNRTLSITNAVSGDYGTLIITQDGTGSRTLTVPNATVPINPTAGASTVIGFTYDGTTFHWSAGYNVYLTNITRTPGIDSIKKYFSDGSIVSIKDSTGISQSQLNDTAAAIRADFPAGGGATPAGTYGNAQINRNGALSANDSLTVDSARFKSKFTIQQGNNINWLKIKTSEIPATSGSSSYADSYSSGDRTATITATALGGLILGGAASYLVNGNTTEGVIYFASGAAVDGTFFIKFDFGSGKIIDEAKFYQSATSTHGTWKWQGSNDNSAWTDIGSSFTLGGFTPYQTQTSLNGNSTSYRYYKLTGVSGTTSQTPYIREFEFKVGGGGGSVDSTHAKIYTNTNGIAIGDTLTKKVNIGGHIFDSTQRVEGSSHIIGTQRIDALPNAVGIKAVRYNPSTGNLSYADTTTAGSTPGIDAVLAAGPNLTANRSINGAGIHKLQLGNFAPSAIGGYNVDFTNNGSDAAGDLFYRTDSGWTRKPTGTTKQVLHPDGSGGYVWRDTTAVPVAGYKEYTALISQTGTSAPTVTVFKNDLSGAIVWTRSTTGVYIGTLTGAFGVSSNPAVVGFCQPAGSYAAQISFRYLTDDTVEIKTAESGTLGDTLLNLNSLTIRVYPLAP
jgi:hypothetical protein